jgi:hypothetical protein
MTSYDMCIAILIEIQARTSKTPKSKKKEKRKEEGG